MSTNTASVLEKIHDSDAGIRRKAVREALTATEMPIIEALCEALGDPNKGVQNSAIESLSRNPHPNVITALIPVIRGFDLNTRNAGMTILKTLGPVAIPPLIEAINKATDVDEIIQILVVFGNIGSPLATETVMNYVGYEDDNVKTTAVEALGKIQDPKSVKTLINTYHQTDILKYSVVEALGNISVKDAIPILLSAVESEDVLEYFSGIGAMGAMEEKTFIEPLLKKLMKEDDSGTRRLIVKSLSQIEEANPGSFAKVEKAPLRTIVNSLLEQSDAAEYIHIVKVAAALEDETYSANLVSSLDHADNDIQELAFQGLMKLGAKSLRVTLDRIGKISPQALIRIMEYLEKVPHADTPAAILPFVKHSADGVRQGVVRTLSVNPSEASYNALKEMLGDIDETVRRLSVAGIKGMMQFDGALSSLIGMMKDANGHVRREACLSMKSSTSKQVVEPLMNVVLTDPYGDVREVAAGVLAARKDPEITKKLLELLDGDNSRIRETIAKTIWQCGWALAVESLIHKLADKEWRVVVNACQSLEKMKDPKSIFPLKELLKNTDWQIRIAALSALKSFKSKELKQAFVHLLEDSNPAVAKMAVESLSEMEDKSLEETFRKHLNHPRWEVRYQIIKALGKIRSQKAVDSLIKFVETDSNNGVRSKALLALARIKDNKACQAAAKLLENEDRDLVVSAVKFFLQFENPQVPDLEAKLQKIMLANPWIKNYFIASYAENACPLLESVLKAVAAPREMRRVEKNKTAAAETGMTNEEGFLLREIIAEKCGILFPDKKHLERQLTKDLGKFYITTWIEYYHALKYGSDDQSVLMSLYDTITDPRTNFFAEPEQCKVLVKSLLPELIEEKKKAGQNQIRILSCGCSFGPEPYSLAMNILEDVHSDTVKLSVTGIDISHICLNTAKRGIYKREILRTADQKFIDLYFEDDRGDLRIKDEVKNMVEFKYLNLSSTQEVEALGAFDIIVCRNVFSAFSQRERERLSENLYNILAPGGTLLISAKETLYNVTKAFKLQSHDKVVVYRKA